jgi:hypothetical protein
MSEMKTILIVDDELEIENFLKFKKDEFNKKKYRICFFKFRL